MLAGEIAKKLAEKYTQIKTIQLISVVDPDPHGSTFKKSSWIRMERCGSGSRRNKSLENVQVH